ncbi:hypothetical protein LX69_03390 [Breznakibacter xylanolyticus]|uniref:Uncharacterized protein n=1 Tax=Breznakibacter xylanolyticus TaxID=990 RepID=A0A2W7MQ88_9BACT|nr:hypothetical protein [Breznakibacter xylanolyticus]PZX10375.1 hypothetical protein LX69_03390 [Breznakibacter xylanolyticus]
MSKLIIPSDHQRACLNVLEHVSQNMPFKRDEFKLLDSAIRWMKKPSPRFTFQFGIRLSYGGESTYIDIEYNGWQFSMSQYNVAYYPDSGSDWYSAYEYKCSADETEEHGEVYNWENMAMNLLGYFGQEDVCETLEVTISKGD